MAPLLRAKHVLYIFSINQKAGTMEQQETKFRIRNNESVLSNLKRIEDV
jgi:hypothetical protein